MPEYLAPGVYVEEVSFRSKSIEGVATSTTGYAGMTRWGPVRYTGGPTTVEPRLITSYTEFERVYGGLEQLLIDRGDGQATSNSYVAHAVRAFFLNGGKRVYVSRTFQPSDPGDGSEDWGISSLPLPFGATDSATWRGRWPGAFGNVLLKVRAIRKGNVAFDHTQPSGPVFGTQARGLTRGAVVEITAPGGTPPLAGDDLVAGSLAVVAVDETVTDIAGLAQQTFLDTTGAPVAVAAGSTIKEVTLQAVIEAGNDRIDVYDELATHPAQRRWVAKIMQANDPEDENAILWLDT
ncbi:MAG: phage tail sheath family protein, partial [Actinomycetota bacterium]